MTEHLELLVTGHDDAVRALLRRELPTLHQRITIEQGRMTTLLADGEAIFLTFDEMRTLYWFLERHRGIITEQPPPPGRTVAEILRYRRNVYLGPAENRGHGNRYFVPDEIATNLYHNPVQPRRRRGARNEEEEDAGSQRDARRTAGERRCPNQGREFYAARVGYTWDSQANRGGAVYQCRQCDAYFNMGNHPTPEHAELAQALEAAAPYCHP